MMANATPYDPIFDAQRHFRVLLDCMARPGKIAGLADVPLAMPTGLGLPAALIGFALLNEYTSFWIHPSLSEASSYFQRQTGSRSCPLEKADFLFGSVSMETNWVQKAPLGTAEYPESGSTLIAEINEISNEPLKGTMAITLKGPGIDQAKTLHVSGKSENFWHALREKNENYPLGVDTFLVTKSGLISAIPRSTKLDWER
ncbi:alpha-D-ribose 1-methylphosphonate 5-triphosphate synthase subunit PhnH [Cyclobacterium xiamenense]|uniref:Alpha-D-ribose 1-methylphosphonate 5-triphosphate synthase subunit PhnH n=1 Tax=Cyclobacterium xiamenense TaxID=1297121 RepID=A0A1H6TQP8_9BACT|nr:phosphonate C-P lyase system protein PhnH [Cyclobacterium xiamenense]SEI79547.1 alpha-D-ribose 1-methylphosphonate 5-triphosphate synthase subunit PhnH [Cyclobacterium xiamenense]